MNNMDRLRQEPTDSSRKQKRGRTQGELRASVGRSQRFVIWVTGASRQPFCLPQKDKKSTGRAGERITFLGANTEVEGEACAQARCAPLSSFPCTNWSRTARPFLARHPWGRVWAVFWAVLCNFRAFSHSLGATCWWLKVTGRLGPSEYAEVMDRTTEHCVAFRLFPFQHIPAHPQRLFLPAVCSLGPVPVLRSRDFFFFGVWSSWCMVCSPGLTSVGQDTGPLNISKSRKRERAPSPNSSRVSYVARQGMCNKKGRTLEKKQKEREE